METPTPTTEAAKPKVCARCAYFRPIPQNQFANCHGNPPEVERGPSGQPFSVRPQVLPGDRACRLFEAAS